MEVTVQIHAPAVLHPGAKELGDYVGYRAGLDVVENREITLFSRELNHGRPAHGLLLCRLSYQVTHRKEILFIYFNYNHSC